MPSLLLHMAAIERLAAIPGRCRRDRPGSRRGHRVRAAGGALPDLPTSPACSADWGRCSRSRAVAFSRGSSTGAPVAMGLKMAELVANGALVGTEAGAGVRRRVLQPPVSGPEAQPLVERLVARHGVRRARAGRAPPHRLTQALFYVRELHGRELLGSARSARSSGAQAPGAADQGHRRGCTRSSGCRRKSRWARRPRSPWSTRGFAGCTSRRGAGEPAGRLRALPSYTSLTYRELYQARTSTWRARSTRRWPPRARC